MADYYYIDLYFDPGEHDFCTLVLESTFALLETGCTLKKVVIPTPESPTNMPGTGVS